MVIWMAQTQTISVLVVDDSPLFLDALTHFVATQPDVTLAGVATSANEGLHLFQQLQPPPNLVVISYNLPNQSGLELLTQLKGQPNPPHVVMMTVFDIPAYREQGLKLGAKAVIAKQGFADKFSGVLNQLKNSPTNGLPAA